MSWWQRVKQRSASRRHSVLLKFFFLSCILHSIVLGILLLMRSSTVHEITLRKYPVSAIKIMPLRKHVAGAMQTINQSVEQIAPQSMPATKTISSQPVRKKTSPPAQQKKKNVDKQKKIVKQRVKKPVEQKNKKKIADKKSKVPEKEKEPEKKPEPKKEELPKPDPQPEKELPKEEVMPTQTVPLTDVAPTTSEALVIYVGREDARMIALYQEVQQALEEQWHAPAGMAPTTMCTLRAFINTTGMAENVRIEQSSGVLMYDVAARTALLKTIFPVAIRGQELVIRF